MGVVLPRSGEVGVDVDDAAHVADKDEGRPSVVGGKGAGIFNRLPLRPSHQVLPVPRGTGPRAADAGMRPANSRLLLAVRQPELLGFEHEGATPIEIDASHGAAAARAPGDPALENVVVMLVGGVGWFGFRQVERAAETDQEELVIRPLLTALAPLPAGNEGFDRIVVRPNDTRKLHASGLSIFYL